MKRKKVSFPRFNLKEPSSEKPTLIFLIYRYKIDLNGDHVRLKYSTNKSVEKKYWLGDRIKETPKHPEYSDINRYLLGLKNEALKIAFENPLIDVDDFKELLDVFSGYKQATETFIPTLPDHFDQYILKKNMDKRTVQKFQGIRDKLKIYEKEKAYALNFDKVTEIWLKDFTNWLETKGVNSVNTISKYVDIIKQVCSDAAQTKIIENGTFRLLNLNNDYRNFRIQRVQTSKFYFEYEEMQLLSKYKTGSAAHEVVLDYFLMMCMTGLRVSDIFGLSKTNFEGDVIRVFTFKGRNTKADNEVVIPVLPIMKDMIEKYDYSFPKPFSEQKHNEYIKMIVNDAGLSRKVMKKSGDKRQQVTVVDLSSQITNHTGRYTFINIMINEFGVDPMELQKITGQSLKVLLGYERGDKVRNATKVLEKITPMLRKIK